MGLFIVLAIVAALAFAGPSSSNGSAESFTKLETLLEPPSATSATANYVIELETKGETSDGEQSNVAASWRVLGRIEDGERPILGQGTNLPSRDEALEQAYDAIAADQGKLPTAINRHGLRVAADCSKVDVQNLNEWLMWAEPRVDGLARELATAKKLSGAELMRGLWAAAFPECVAATPRIRKATWVQTTRRVQRLVQKELAGTFIDLNPIARVLAARMVGMSPPKIDGRAFWYEAKSGQRWAVKVTRFAGNWHWRVWQSDLHDLQGPPRETGDAKTEIGAANAAKAWIDGLATAGVDVGG